MSSCYTSIIGMQCVQNMISLVFDQFVTKTRLFAVPFMWCGEWGMRREPWVGPTLLSTISINGTIWAFLFLFLFLFLGTGSQSRENQDEEHNEERKKNNTNYNKGTPLSRVFKCWLFYDEVAACEREATGKMGKYHWNIQQRSTENREVRWPND